MITGDIIAVPINKGMTASLIIYTKTGSTVTVDGDIITEVSGVWTISPISTGSHTVVVTYEYKTKTLSVLIDTITTYTIQVSLSNTDYVYYYGDFCTDITGGWNQYHSYSTSWWTSQKIATKNSDNIQFYRTSMGITTLGTNSKIDLSQYSLVSVCMTQTSTASTDSEFTFEKVVTFSANHEGGGNTYVSLWKSGTITDKTLKNATLSDSGTKYISLFAMGNSPNFNIKVYGVALAKTDDISVLSEYGSTISEILTNSSSLLSSESGVYNMLSCTGNFMWQALANSTWKSAYASSSYKSIIDADMDWAKALALLS